MSLELNPVEARLLGVLLEKERTTPELYPLSLHSATAACNQTSNRDPVLTLAEQTVEQGLDSLREKKLAVLIRAAGARVPKYRHTLLDTFNLEPGEIAVLCVLLLRGAQTPGELKARTERMFRFGSLLELENCLEELARGEQPLVAVVPPRPGQKERRYVQLLSIKSDDANAPADESWSREDEVAVIPRAGATARLDALEAAINEIKEELATLRERIDQLTEKPGVD